MGERKTGSRTETSPDGIVTTVRQQPRCWLSADCIQDKRRKTPGDAVVAIDCRARQCECLFELFAPFHKRIKFRFSADEPCADDARLTGLLWNQCLSEGRRQTKPLGRRVQQHTIPIRSGTTVTTEHKTMKTASGALMPATVITTVTVSISGEVWAYRPQPASSDN